MAYGAIPMMIAMAAMAAGTAVQQNAQQTAARRQQRAMRESMQRQQFLQREAEAAALKKAQEFSPDEREKQRNEIEQQITENLAQAADAARPVQEAPSVQGNVSSEYLTGRAQSQSEQAKSARALAALFGKTISANRLRQNEILGLADTGQYIDRLKSFSNGQMSADQIGIHSAGIPNGGQMMAGGVLQGLGQAGMMAYGAGAWGGEAAAGGAASSGAATGGAKAASGWAGSGIKTPFLW